MKTIIAKRIWLAESDLRLDASYHLSDGQLTLIAFKKSNIPTKPLKNVTDRIFYGGRSRRIYVNSPEFGLPFIKGADIIKADFSNLKYISRKRTPNLKEYFLEEGWTTITRSGTIGNTAYINKDFIGKAASDDIIRVIPKSIPSGYLYAFLSSKNGKALLTHGTYGAVIQHIEPEHIENLPVPIFPTQQQQTIHDLILESANLRVKANEALEKAVNYFNNRYSDKLILTTKVFNKNINDLTFSWASYNNNIECDAIENIIGKDKLTIDEIATDVFAPPLFKHIYLTKDNGHPFLTGGELTQNNPRYYRYLSPRGVKNILDYKVTKGTLLLYKSGTTDGGILGNVFIVDDNLASACLSDHVIRINIPDLKLSYWVFAFLKSIAGIRLLQKLATGTMIPFITPERLKSLVFPKPNKDFDTVVNHVSNYLEKRVLSNNKENQAIQIVEKEIEQWQQ